MSWGGVRQASISCWVSSSSTPHRTLATPKPTQLSSTLQKNVGSLRLIICYGKKSPTLIVHLPGDNPGIADHNPSRQALALHSCFQMVAEKGDGRRTGGAQAVPSLPLCLPDTCSGAHLADDMRKPTWAAHFCGTCHVKSKEKNAICRTVCQGAQSWHRERAPATRWYRRLLSSHPSQAGDPHCCPCTLLPASSLALQIVESGSWSLTRMPSPDTWCISG